MVIRIPHIRIITREDTKGQGHEEGDNITIKVKVRGSIIKTKVKVKGLITKVKLKGLTNNIKVQGSITQVMQIKIREM